MSCGVFFSLLLGGALTNRKHHFVKEQELAVKFSNWLLLSKPQNVKCSSISQRWWKILRHCLQNVDHQSQLTGLTGLIKHYLAMSTLADHFTIGKVAFGKTDYVELSAYFSAIICLFMVIYFQLFNTVSTKNQVSQSLTVEAYPVQTVTIIEGISYNLIT